jgi:curved DNA-binding protein CbpA
VRLYGLLAAGNHTGLLTLTLADCTVSLHFRKGNPEFIDSSHPEDALSTSLLQAKLVTPEQLQQAEAARGRFGGELLAALFGLGLLQPPSAFTQLAHRAQTILLKGLRAESGSFAFEPKDLPPAKAMPLGNKWAVLSDLVRRIPSADLRRRLQPVLGLPVMKSNGRVATGDLRLTPHEVRVLALIDGVRSTGQLLTDVPQDADHVLRLVFLLRELDGVSFAAVAQRTAPPPQAPASAPQAAAPARAVTAPGVAQAGATPQATAPAPGRAVTVPGVAQAGATPQATAPAPGRAVTAPGVAQTGAAPQATAPAAKPATPAAKPAAPATPAAKPAAPAAKPAAPAPTAAKPAAPAPAAKPAAPAPTAAPAASGSAPGADEIPTLRELAEKLKEQNHFERLGLGADTNGPAVKIAYFKLARQYHPDTLPPGAPPELEKLKADVFAYIGEAYRTLSDDKSRAAYIEELKHGGKQEQQVDIESILKSEELFRKAGLHIKARKFAEAVKILDEAIQLNAEEPEFYAWRGYARFFTFEDKKVAYNEAFRDIQLCLKKNEKVASAHYFLGVIAKLCGDNSGALKHFQKTVEIQPNHIDAQREIRMAAQKK